MDMDDAYANAKYIPQAETYVPRWTQAAAAFRERAGSETDIAYGDQPRERFDLFLPEGTPQGLMVFVHGGYWRAFEKSMWSHLAAGALARGWAVAMPGYTLAPEARVAAITRQIARAVTAAAGRVAGPVVLAGHSAGGHLVSRMLCGDVALPDDVAARLLRVVPISPVTDLRPLLQTAINDDLRMDMAEATDESPALHRDVRDVPVTVWVGGAERPVFLDQARWLADNWSNATLHIAPDLHHFNVIEGLENKNGPLMTALLG
ncbi:alpha/beta hydrolase [Pseudogemmobacter sp. W21_MBD1_M6]|uniref:alpha/beta hydrolase n=1 Tax=Pseudogemmobacter sp. W21_MBD1_M6 TaxID=3240271 RepID=UPI003F959766